jgi:hypothetical protein
MAVNDDRSMNKDLKLGVADGKFKCLTPDRGGIVEQLAPTVRHMQLQPQYNIAERPETVDVTAGLFH